jgi:hypothetical protein
MISSENTVKVYIGSTIQTLEMRLKGHKDSYEAYKKDKKTYTTSFEIIKVGDYVITLLEDVNVETLEELEKRERFYIENTPECVNKQHPGRTKKEYNDTNKDKISEQKKEYRKENLDRMTEYAKNYRENNQDAIKKYANEHKEEKTEYNKQYRQDNHDALLKYEQDYRDEHKTEKKAYNAKYNEENKAKVSLQKSKKVMCECGEEYSMTHRARHMKTKKHLDGIPKKVANQQ